MPLIIPMEYTPVIIRVAQITGIAAALMTLIIGTWKIIAYVKKLKTKEEKYKRKYFKIEKNAVLLPGIPMVKSPKGYVYHPDQDPKTRTLFCGKCYMATLKRIPLSETGSRFSKELVCPDCETVYGK